MRRASAVRRLEGIARLTRCGQSEAPLRHRRAADIAAQPFQLRALPGLNAQARVP